MSCPSLLNDSRSPPFYVFKLVLVVRLAAVSIRVVLSLFGSLLDGFFILFLFLFLLAITLSG
jgi:hypothetical protein